MSKTPADTIIEKFGGHRAIADILDIDISRVYRWTYPQEAGGTGGSIPQRHQILLMHLARDRGISLSPADFFPDHDVSAASPPEAA